MIIYTYKCVGMSVASLGSVFGRWVNNKDKIIMCCWVSLQNEVSLMSLECVCTHRRLCTQLYIVQYACMVTVYVVKLFIPQQRRRRAEQWGDQRHRDSSGERHRGRQHSCRQRRGRRRERQRERQRRCGSGQGQQRS